MTEPRNLFELTEEILKQSASFSDAQKKYAEKFNKKNKPTEYEMEYRKKLFEEKPETPPITEQVARDIFWMTAKKINPNYIVPEKIMVRNLVNYFFGFDGELDTGKGLLICGGTGSGKTQFFSIIQMALQYTGKSFRMFNCIEIEQAIRFGGDYSAYDNGDVCFDDLGAEQIETLMYGNRVIPMSEILQRRYVRRDGGKTHVTTNLNMIEIQNRYGSRVSDRLREICNLVIFDRGSFRK